MAAGRADLKAEIAALAAEIALGAAGSAERIDGAVAAVVARGDPACVPLLLGLLDDAHARQGAMWSLMHAAESFPAPDYVRGLVQALPGLDRRAPGWAVSLAKGALNGVRHRPALAAAMDACPDATADAVRSLFARIAARDPELFAGKVYEVVSALRDPG